MKEFNLNVDDVISIIEDKNKGMYVNDLAIKYKTTNATVVRLYKAFYGNKKYYNSLGVKSRRIVDECIRLKKNNIVNLQVMRLKYFSD